MTDRENNRSDDEEKDIIISPQKENYKDRKMAKWMGFILSDHTESIQRNQAEEEQQNLPKERLTEEVITTRLEDAFATKQTVTIQLNFISDGKFEDDIVGKIAGFNDGFVYVQTADDFLSVSFALIRHIDFSDQGKWFDV